MRGCVSLLSPPRNRTHDACAQSESWHLANLQRCRLGQKLIRRSKQTRRADWRSIDRNADTTRTVATVFISAARAPKSFFSLPPGVRIKAYQAALGHTMLWLVPTSPRYGSKQVIATFSISSGGLIRHRIRISNEATPYLDCPHISEACNFRD